MNFKQDFKKFLQNRRTSRLIAAITGNKTILIILMLLLVAGIMIVYYGHERLWSRVRWGLINYD